MKLNYQEDNNYEAKKLQEKTKINFSLANNSNHLPGSNKNIGFKVKEFILKFLKLLSK